MKYFINEQLQQAQQNLSLAQAIEIYMATEPNTKLSEDSFVIAVNQSFVPRSEYQALLINEGDKIELLSPMAGG